MFRKQRRSHLYCPPTMDRESRARMYARLLTPERYAGRNLYWVMDVASVCMTATLGRSEVPA